MRSYLDLFGNRVTRVEVPAGLVTFTDRFVIAYSGEPDANAARRQDDADRRPPRRHAALPGGKPLLRQRQVRRFRLVAVRKLSGGARGCRRSRISSTRKSASATRTRARPAAPAIPCRKASASAATSPTRHRALRCMNIPARYCTGYLGDIGVPVDVNPGDFSAWGEVFLDGRWWTMDARHNHPRIGRIVMGRGRDAADVAMSTAFGVANLKRFVVVTTRRSRGDDVLRRVGAGSPMRPGYGFQDGRVAVRTGRTGRLNQFRSVGWRNFFCFSRGYEATTHRGGEITATITGSQIRAIKEGNKVIRERTGGGTREAAARKEPGDLCVHRIGQGLAGRQKTRPSCNSTRCDAGARRAGRDRDAA